MLLSYKNHRLQLRGLAVLKQDVVVPSEQDIAHHVAHRRLVAESGNGRGVGLKRANG